MDQQREIEQIAYELYLQRGGKPGDPVADWFLAERIYVERQTQVGSLEMGVDVVEEVEVAPKKVARKKADTAKTVAPKAEKTVKAPTIRAKKTTKKSE